MVPAVNPTRRMIVGAILGVLVASQFLAAFPAEAASGPGSGGSGSGGSGSGGSGSSGSGGSGSGNSGSSGSGSSNSGSGSGGSGSSNSGSSNSGSGRSGSGQTGNDDAGDRHGGQNEEGRDVVLDQRAARQGVERGEFLPLARILGTVQAAKLGQVVAVDLARRQNGQAFYRVRVVNAAGEVWQVLVDAKKDRLLEVRRQ